MDTATPDGSKFSLPHQLMFPDAHSSSGHLTAGRNLLGGAYGGPSSGPSHQQMLLDYEEASPSRHGPSHRREWKPLMGMIRVSCLSQSTPASNETLTLQRCWFQIFAGNGRGDGGVYAAATLTALARSVHSILCQVSSIVPWTGRSGLCTCS